jgi:hypothetical protein
MAFEVPLEADRVDDLNLFSTFVRAPVIGTLLWILGGNKAKEEEEREQQQHKLGEDDSSFENNSNDDLMNKAQMKRSFSKRSGGLKKTAPSLIGSEISDMGEIRESLDTLALDGELSSDKLNGQFKKELSWSDESGRGDLVQYVDEVGQGCDAFWHLKQRGFAFPGTACSVSCCDACTIPRYNPAFWMNENRLCLIAIVDVVVAVQAPFQPLAPDFAGSMFVLPSVLLPLPRPQRCHLHGEFSFIGREAKDKTAFAFRLLVVRASVRRPPNLHFCRRMRLILPAGAIMSGLWTRSVDGIGHELSMTRFWHLLVENERKLYRHTNLLTPITNRLCS